METVRITISPLSESQRWGIRAGGYIELRNSPNPDSGKALSGLMRVVDVGPDWIDVERD